MKNFLLLLALVFGNISLASSKLEVCRSDSGLVGFCNQEGDVVIPYIYYDALDFVDGYAAVLMEDKWGIIDRAGEVVMKPIFDDMIECEHADLILVRQETKWHLVNSKGEAQTETYDVENPEAEFKLNGAVAEFNTQSWFAVSKKGKWGAVTLTDEVKIEFDYKWLKIIRLKARGNEEVVGVVLKNKKDKYAWQDPSGMYTSGFIFDHYLGVNADHIFFQKSGKLMVLDAISGDEIEIKGSDSFVLRNDQNLVGMVNARIGRVVIPFEYDEIDNTQIKYHALIKKGYQVGLANMFGDMLLEAEYEEIKPLFQNPLVIAVRNASRKVSIMAIDANDLREITPFKYTFAKPDGDKFYVGIGNKHGHVTMDGEEIWKE